jgi:hypothetical protein
MKLLFELGLDEALLGMLAFGRDGRKLAWRLREALMNS